MAKKRLAKQRSPYLLRNLIDTWPGWIEVTPAHDDCYLGGKVPCRFFWGLSFLLSLAKRGTGRTNENDAQASEQESKRVTVRNATWPTTAQCIMLMVANGLALSSRGFLCVAVLLPAAPTNKTPVPTTGSLTTQGGRIHNTPIFIWGNDKVYCTVGCCRPPFLCCKFKVLFVRRSSGNMSREGEIRTDVTDESDCFYRMGGK